MKQPHYLDLDGARKVLSELGVEFNSRQMKRATDMDGEGKRKLPFFLDPIDGRLKIEKDTLINIYLTRQVTALKNSRLTP